MRIVFIVFIVSIILIILPIVIPNLNEEIL